MPLTGGVHLHHGGERAEEIAALTSRLGGRVGLDGVLGDLNRAATLTRVPGKAAAWGFRWCDEDNRSPRWFPQGITTSADRGPLEHVNGHRVICTSWYSRQLRGVDKGSRITFVDITDPNRPRYRHVLLVQPVRRRDGRVGVVPLRAHAGGLVWHGPYLYVAGTARGIYCFRVEDILRVYSCGDAGALSIEDGHVDSFGYRYVLPVRFTYEAGVTDGEEPLRYSFVSIDRTAMPHRLVAGEYGDRSMTTRVFSYEVDPSSALLVRSDDGRAWPVTMHEAALRSMQGATVVDGTYYVSTSAGRRRRGSLWVGTPGELRRFRHVLPVGPEDLTYWPSTGQLWSLTEYPGRRFVFAMDRSDFDTT